MKKIVYTIAFLLATGTCVQAQTQVKQSKEELADFMLLENNLLVFTVKEAKGQYIYSEQRGESASTRKETALNAGVINTVVGRNRDNNELFVYQKNGRNEEVISFYTLKDGSFEKTGERPMPKLRNHSHTLGMFLSEDKQTLILSAELGRSRGYDDLYLSKWENDRWTSPKHLGKNVNTQQPEFAPFVANDSLYFTRKDAETAYIYGVPFNQGQPEANPVRLSTAINMANTYNAYYRKQEDIQTWISASTDKAFYYAYVLEKPVVEVIEEVEIDEAVVVEEVPVPELVVKKKADEPALVLLNGFNSVRLGLEGISALARFLRDQPEGTALVIKGYSDGYGPAEAKDYVSRNRAVSVKQYIDRYFAGKKFVITLENEVKVEKGKLHRKTEVYLMQ
ncbi:hypothetical protein ABID22_003276 [Pontibacter aydingkolensis]|uniref:OmpA family protein n=1 Tax=Pontibacter aydingkolensis TaxID=1911536 RepID=A0ABS7CUB3_9BACT|nr:hypothetical protein [Pontibacter aydingkolensis]MBW7467454.1 hypothetical protein [Pontibacter aydingkolensis]